MDHPASARLQTEVGFTLPKGYIDPDGVLHRHGTMRLATAADEILPRRDHRVRENPDYLAIIVLSRVIVKLGSVRDIDTKLVENLFAADFDYLQRLYEKINSIDEADAAAPYDDGPAAFSGGMRAVGEA